jgi:hypothetical protein
MNSLWWPDWAAKVIKVQRCPWHPGRGELLHPDPWQASGVRVEPLAVVSQADRSRCRRKAALPDLANHE